MPMYGAKINPQPPSYADKTQPQRHSLRIIDGVNSGYSFDNTSAACLILRAASGKMPFAATTLGGTGIVAMPIYCA